MVVLSLPASGSLIQKGPLDLPDNAPGNFDKGVEFSHRFLWLLNQAFHKDRDVFFDNTQWGEITQPTFPIP